MMVLGVESKQFFSTSIFNNVAALHDRLKKINGVVTIISVPEAITLVKNDSMKNCNQ
jgi:predicted RND superfamily exporter protein